MHRSAIPESPTCGALSREDVHRTICDRFARVARACAERVAVADDSCELTYRDLELVTNSQAHRLIRKGGRSDEPVGLVFNQGLPFIVAVLSVLKAGKFFVPLDPRDDSGHRAVLQQSGCGLLMYDHCNREAGESMSGIEGLAVASPFASRASPPRIDADANSYCYVYYTTGSTGAPKGVVDIHRNVLHNAYRYTSMLEIRPQDRLSIIQSPSFSGCMSSLFSALLTGATLCPFDLQAQGLGRLPEWVRRREISIYHSVPSIFRCLARPGSFYPSVRLLRLEGDRAARVDIETYLNHFDEHCRLAVGFGATECGLARQFLVDREKAAGLTAPPLGYACPDVRVTITGEDGTELEPGRVGEITIHGAFLAPGYWGAPELTHRAFIDNGDGVRTYLTGDLGYLDAGGCLHYVSRQGARIKIRGQTVDTARVEAAVTATGLADSCVATGHVDEKGEARLACYYVTDRGQPAEPLEFKNALIRALPGPLLPRYYVPVPGLPVSADGKVSYRQLPPPEDRHRVRIPPGIEPRTQVEREVARLWGEVLGLDIMDVHWNVFELGVDSLATEQFRAGLAARLHVELSIDEIFDNSTVALAACLIESRQNGTRLQPREHSPARRDERLARQELMKSRRRHLE